MAQDGTSLEFHFRTQEAWDAMYRDCLNARESIEMEQYILMDDEAGGRFLDLFLEKARAGLRVRLVLDAIGSRGILWNRKIDALRQAGGEVRFFNLPRWRRLLFPSRWLPRTHVKTLLVDGKIAYTGSACMWHLMHEWHDLHLRVTGPVVEQVREDLSRLWLRWRHKWRSRLTQPPPPQGLYRYVVSEPHLGTSPFYKELLKKIKGAKQRIRIVTPYFLPPRRLRRALEHAAARGVKVEVIMSHATDVPLADYTSRVYFPRLLERGLALYLFPDTVLHAKYMMIDGDWASVGSVNIDYLSLTKNREASLVIADRDVIGHLWDKSAEYLARCTAVSHEHVKNIPAYGRIAGYIGQYMKEVL